MAVKTGNPEQLSLEGENPVFIRLIVKTPKGEDGKIDLFQKGSKCLLIFPSQRSNMIFPVKEIKTGQQITLPIESSQFTDPTFQEEWKDYIVSEEQAIAFHIVSIGIKELSNSGTGTT